MEPTDQTLGISLLLQANKNQMDHLCLVLVTILKILQDIQLEVKTKEMEWDWEALATNKGLTVAQITQLSTKVILFS